MFYFVKDDYICLFLKCCIELECFPQLNDLQLNIYSVNYVAKAIVCIFKKKINLNDSGKTYHIVNNEDVLFFNFFFDKSLEFGYSVVSKPFEEWKKLLLKKEFDNINENIKYLFLDIFTIVNRKQYYSKENFLKELKEENIIKDDFKNFLDKFFLYFVGCNFFKKPQNSNTIFYQKVMLNKNYFEFITRNK